MQTRIEEIDPRLAETYLNTMKANRPLSNATVTKYAGMMRKGQWLTTHQGIAFNEAGELIDGQHRLYAVMEAETSIKILVTRGIPSVVETRHAKLASMDAIDGMRARTTADQLHLNHDVAWPKQTHAAFAVIAQIVGGPKFSGLTVPQAVQFLDIYGKDANAIITELHRFRPVRAAAVAGTLAFSRGVYRDEVDQFAVRLTSGEGLKAGDPCLVLRNKLINTGLPTHTGVNTGRLDGCRMVANALLKSIEGKSMQVLLPSEEGLSVLRNKQKSNIAKVRNILGVNEAKA